MKFIMRYKDGSKETFSGGCFGCIGRTDSYRPKDGVTDQVKFFNSRSNHGVGKSYCRDLYEEETECLVLPREFVADTATHVWHSKTQGDIVKYLIQRSPFKDCFISTVQEFFSEEQCLLKTHDVPSELVISLAFVLRELSYRPSHGLTFTHLATVAPDVPEFIRFFLCIVTPDLYMGSGSKLHVLGDYNRDGVIFPSEMRRDSILNPDSIFNEGVLCPASIDQVGGYTMNVSYLWKAEEIGGSLVDMSDVLYRLNVKYNKTKKVEGVFGPLSYVGIIDVREYVLAFVEKLNG